MFDRGLGAMTPRAPRNRRKFRKQIRIWRGPRTIMRPVKWRGKYGVADRGGGVQILYRRRAMSWWPESMTDYQWPRGLLTKRHALERWANSVLFHVSYGT